MKKESQVSSRRRFLGTASALVAAPWVIGQAKAADKRLMVRTPGGVFDEIKKRTVYEPFRRETGIEIVPVPATAGKLIAMFRAGQPGVDVVDIGNDAILYLHRIGAIQDLDYNKFKFTDPNDIDPSVRLPYQVGSSTYANVMCYNTGKFKPGSEPKNWQDFWDIGRFPGNRTMPGIESGSVSLDLALMADGVAVDKLYPIDIPRAFKSLSKIRPSVPKFWDSGALSTQMMTSGDAVLGVLWSSRAQVAIDAGAPIGLQWNGNETLVQALAITKTAKNPDAALQYIDYNLSPVVQARWLAEFDAIPVNKKAYPAMRSTLIDPDTKLPWTVSKGHAHNIEWWADNNAKVAQYWANWIIS
jgi:putative spermidine/putrescine transport system substrate-binding protein